MRMLQKMIEVMRTEGYVVALPGGMPGNLPGQIIRWTVSHPTEREWKLFEKTEPFVFSTNPPMDRTEDANRGAANWQEGHDKNDAIDAPFPVFSIEYLDGAPLDFFIMPDFGDRRETIAILVIEITPKAYGYYALCKDPKNWKNPFKVFKSNAEGDTVEAVIQRLNTEKMGIETTRATVKIGSGKEKRIHRIRRVVHVSPKKLMTSYESQGVHVDWSHRWEVRGHWRQFGGLGKDRDGNYSVNGFTWVVHHEKGPEHLPLVKKTRFVKE